MQCEGNKLFKLVFSSLFFADEHFLVNGDYLKQQQQQQHHQRQHFTIATNNCQLSTTISCVATTNTVSTFPSTSTTETTKLISNPMTKQLSANTTPSGVSTTTTATTAVVTAIATGVGLTSNLLNYSSSSSTSSSSGNGHLATAFLNANLTPTIISPTASLSHACIVNATPAKKILQLPPASTTTTSTCHVNQYNTLTTTTTTATTTSLSLTSTTATTATVAFNATHTPKKQTTTTTTTVNTSTTTAKKSSSSSSSSNDANGRSAALERAYVHDVYENCEEPTGSLRPRVAQFLSNLEAGSVVCDVGCGSGRYLTQCNPSICTVGVDRCYRLSRVAKEKGGEVSILFSALKLFGI